MAGPRLDPSDPSVTVGQRIQFFRTRRGMSRAALGGLVGKSERWVKAVETGQLQQPRLPVLLLLAEALRVRDLAQITGDQSLPVETFRGTGHPALPAVRDAVNSIVPDTSGPPAPLDHIQARIDFAWRARHSAPHHRTVIGALLPGLISDAKHAASSYEGGSRRQALSLLAQVYNLAQFFVAYQPAADLLWRIAERSLMAAQESEDPRALGGALWLLAQAHRDSGDFDAADAVSRDSLDLLRPHLPDAGAGLRAMWGALLFEAAYTCARAGQAGAAWGWWDQADAVARTLPPGHYDLMTSFSQVIMSAHAVTIAVETRQAGEAVRQARRAAGAPIPSQPRKGRHLIETARAYHLRDDKAAVLATLASAYTAAPETIRYNEYARRMILQLAQDPGPSRPGARALAGNIGMVI
jgi:transcriptional regulator with XRE-family HTH domain